MPRPARARALVGGVHFLILDSETPSAKGTPQHNFAAADLAAVDRGATPWVVVGMHRMMAAPSKDVRPVVGDQAIMAELQRNYEELFSQHQVGGWRSWWREGGREAC